MTPSASRDVRWHNGLVALQAPTQEQPADDRLTVGVAAGLSRYLQVLTQARKMGKERISSQEISDYTNINATQIRRDLSAFGKFGKRGVGYNIDGAAGRDPQDPAHPGPAQHRAGRRGPPGPGDRELADLRRARHQHRSRLRQGSREGRPRGRQRRRSATYGQLGDVVRDKNIIVGVLAVPADGAQEAADDLVGAGVKIIFNYSEALLDVPPDVQVHTSNPAVELLYALYFHLT